MQHVLFFSAAFAMVLGAPAVATASSVFEIYLREGGGGSEANNCGGDAVERRMADASGAAFLCCVPPPITGDDKPTSDLRLERASAAAAAAAAAVSPSAASPAASSAPPCLNLSRGFWTYSVCPGVSARQFHVEGVTVSSDLSLGAYEPGGDALLLDGAGSVVLRQSFAGGSDGRAAWVDWLCAAPGALSPGTTATTALVGVDEDVAARRYVLHVASRERALCAALPSARGTVAPVNGTCSRFASGWWQFEVCLGGELRQWHDAGGGARVQQASLGVYDWHAGEALDDAAAAAATGEAAPAILQRYTGGSVCDDGSARQTLLRIICAHGEAGADDAGGGAEDASWTVTALDEPSFCSYRLTVAAHAACRHPVLAGTTRADALSAAPTRVIDCRRLGDDADDARVARGDAEAVAEAVTALAPPNASPEAAGVEEAKRERKVALPPREETSPLGIEKVAASDDSAQSFAVAAAIAADGATEEAVNDGAAAAAASPPDSSGALETVLGSGDFSREDSAVLTTTHQHDGADGVVATAESGEGFSVSRDSFEAFSADDMAGVEPAPSEPAASLQEEPAE